MITGYDPETRRISISIGDLIDFGRLPDTLVPQLDPLSVHQRQRVHSSHQRKMTRAGWEREVSVSCCFTAGGIAFDISGRLDLIRESEGITEIVEVKTLQGVPDFSDPVAARGENVLQLYFYVLAVSRTRGIPLRNIRAELHYISMRKRKSEVAFFPLDLADRRLQSMWSQLLDQASGILSAEDIRKSAQTKALESFDFPYESQRPGQDVMLERVRSCIDESGYLMMQAPTGTGKTAAVLSGAVAAALPRRLTVFFLTAKNTHRRIVADTLGLIMERGVPIRALFMAAKATMCLMGRDRCLPHDCPHAVDFGARVRDSGVMEELLAEGLVEPDRLRSAAGTAGVCPFELGLCISTRCDIVVCDYNYAFDPHVYLKRFFLENRTSSRCCLLVDEAANLPSRARDYYSPEVRLSWVEELLSHDLASSVWRRLLRPWIQCFGQWSALLQSSGESEIELPSETAVPSGIDAWMDLIGGMPEPPRPMSDLVRALADFSRIDPDDRRFHLLLRREGQDLVLQWFCTDPSEFLSERLRGCHSRVAFSATLTPMDHFGQLLGFPPEGTVFETVPYPFPQENLGVWICSDIDTRYRYREQCAARLADRILGIYARAPGSWIVFFPSYAYMNSIAGILRRRRAPLLVQEPDMDDAAREEFIGRIEEGSGIALTVSGGIFSEGIDIRSQNLKGAVIVGPSLPGLDLRSRLLAGNYEYLGENGFHHTWVIPGMVRVVQAAGRLIRDGSQVRALVLVGRRFTIQPYFGLLPGHWFTGGSIRILREDCSEIGEFLRKQQEGGAPGSALFENGL